MILNIWLKNNEYWNGKLKLYDDNHELIFEREISNGTNEKHKVYFKNEKIKFEFEYLDGIKWNGKLHNLENNEFFELKDGQGFIKEYNYEGVLIFEGEYFLGEKIGKGKEYDYDGNLIYDGDYFDGIRRNGKGKEYDYDGNLIYDGDYFDGIRWNGIKYEYDEKYVYETEYVNGEIKLENNKNDSVKSENEIEKKKI